MVPVRTDHRPDHNTTIAGSSSERYVLERQPKLLGPSSDDPTGRVHTSHQPWQKDARTITMEDLVLTHDHGFFSNCSVLLESIQQTEGPIAIDTTPSFTMYKSDPAEDVYTRYFQASSEKNERRIFFPAWLCAYCYTSMPLRRFSQSMRQWFTFKDFVVERSLELQELYGIEPASTLALLIRQTDKSTENPLVHPDDIARYVNRIAGKYQTVLLQTDDQSVYEHLARSIDHKVTVISELPRFAPDQSPHLSGQFRNAELLTDFLGTILLISRCKRVILTTSNVSLWIALFRGNKKGLVHLSDIGVLRRFLMFFETRSEVLYKIGQRVLGRPTLF